MSVTQTPITSLAQFCMKVSNCPISDLIVDEIWIINLWKSEKSETSTIKDFLMKRKQFERNKTSIIGQSSFAKALLQVRPELKGIRERCREALTKLERDHYKNHKTLSSSSLNPRLDKNIHILTLFTATPH